MDAVRIKEATKFMKKFNPHKLSIHVDNAFTMCAMDNSEKKIVHFQMYGIFPPGNICVTFDDFYNVIMLVKTHKVTITIVDDIYIQITMRDNVEYTHKIMSIRHIILPKFIARKVRCILPNKYCRSLGKHIFHANSVRIYCNPMHISLCDECKNNKIKTDIILPIDCTIDIMIPISLFKIITNQTIGDILFYDDCISIKNEKGQFFISDVPPNC